MNGAAEYTYKKAANTRQTSKIKYNNVRAWRTYTYKKSGTATLLFRQLGSGIAFTSEQATLSPRYMYTHIHALNAYLLYTP